MFARDSRNLWLTLAGLAITAAYLFPVYWMYVSGFKTSGEIYARPPTLFPRAPSLAAFIHVLGRENMGRALWNSFVIAGGPLICPLRNLVGVPTGRADFIITVDYGVAWIPIKFRKDFRFFSEIAKDGDVRWFKRPVGN